MKKTVKWISISILTIIGVVGIAFLLFLYFLSPARLTPIVNKYSTEYLDATVNFDSVKVSLFEEFPMVSVKLVKGEIISHAMQSDTAFLSEHPVGIDTLMRFNEFMISLNIKDLLRSKINIQRIRISQPSINAYVSPSGRANWEIYTPSETDDDTETPPLDLNIDRFSIRGPATLTYNSRPDSMVLQASIGRLFLKGNITPDLEKLEINKFVCSKVKVNADIESSDINASLAIDSASVSVVDSRREYDLLIKAMVSATVEKQKYCNSLPLKLNGALKLDPDNKNFFGFKDFALTVANLPEIRLNGDILLSDGDITSDLNCKVESLPLQSLLNLVPEDFSDEIQKINTNIDFNLNTTVKGTYKFDETGKLPAITIDFKIPKGQLIYKDIDSKIDNIAIDASFNYDPVSPKNTRVKFRNINLQAFAMTLNGNVDVVNLLGDPNVTLNLQGTANLRELIKFAPEDLGITARGNVSFDVKGSFLASRLNAQDISKNDLVAQFSADRLFIRIPKDTISLMAGNTTVELNTTNTRTNRTTGAVSRLLSIELKSDTARFRMPSRETIALSKVDFSMRTSDGIITGDTSKVIPMVGNVTANALEYAGVDSTTMRLRGVKSNFRILPSRENRTLPTIRFDIESRMISLLSAGNRVGVRNASIALEATKIPPTQRQRRTTSQQQLDSLQRIYPHIQRDSLAAHARTQRAANRRVDDFAGEDIDIRDAELGSMLREWTVNGSIKSRGGRVVSPHFPIRTQLQNIDLAFTTNDITLHDATIKSGESKLSLSGKIDGIRRALSTGRGLKIDANIQADTLNINELLTAAYNGAAYSEASEEYKKALASVEDENQLEKIIQKENENKEEAPRLIVVPSNVSVDVKLNVGYGKYADITINKLTGELVSRDRVLQLKDIVAETNVGVIDMTALYATRSKKDITFGIDLEFANIQVEKFIKIIPAVDSLIPMLSSFKGLVSSQLAATASIDSTMNIIMPSLNAACRIRGKDMVLLDGETFSKIARTLKFKNRKENLVDSISVELLIKDNLMKIYPFVMQMDRYKVAIGGDHNLDMRFKYHISVLKSPLPFALGVNVSGDLDNMDSMKIGIGRALYKDTSHQAYITNMVNNNRLNLRTQINNMVQQGVDAVRFTQFSAPTIDSALIVKDATLTAQDSLALYKEGIIDIAPTLKTDSISSDDSQSRRGRRN
ncbi:MAG: hypothetical protein LBI82_12535 [Dysgonamonadaceae bacterium]|jgi:hypothetical protein|nr:hypothetical protein [Dysgonamonadaceae bacterium]